MKILGIETSTPIGSVGLIDGDKLIAEQALDITRHHSARLMPVIDQTLKWGNLSIQEIDAVAVSVGPGSFTGVRIGVGTAKTICYAIQKPIVGVSTLAAIAYNLRHVESQICVVLDARRDEVYGATFRGGGKWERQSDDLCLPIQDLLTRVTPPTIFSGSGLDRYADRIEDLLSSDQSNSISFADLPFRIPRGINVAWLGLERLVSSDTDDCFTIVPNYIRQGVSHPKKPS